MHRCWTLPIVVAVLPAIAAAARRPIDDSGIQGGLVVVLGCDAPTLDAVSDAARKGPYLVQFLDADARKVDQARERIQRKGLYGRVSANVFDGKKLPHIDNLVNLVLAPRAGGKVSPDEIARVLAPRGVSIVGGKRTVKPVPDDIDEWSHWMHGPDNNPVAQDKVIDVPRHLQWVQEPDWISSHNLNPGVSAVVTSGGRVLSIINEMPPGIKGMEDKWMLTARDAFNGLVLWARPIKQWGWTHWSEREESVEMRFVPPFQVMRRLVAADDLLFVTPGFYSPVHVLDAASGREVRVLEGTEKTFEILHIDGVLYLAINDSIGTENMIPAIAVVAVDPGTGKTLWRTGGFRGISAKLNSLYKHANVFLTAGTGGIVLLDGNSLISLDRKTGKARWRAARPGKRLQLADADILSLARGGTRTRSVPRYRADQFFPNNCALVHSNGTIVLTEIKDELKNYKTRLGKTACTAAYDAASGKELWRFDGVTFAHFVPPDLFVINDLVWTLDGETKSYVGLDLRTGKKTRSYAVESLIWRAGGHQLCFRNKATTEMIIFGRRKSEFINVRTGAISTHAWIKGMCNYGVMPANGMIYYPPHNCSCYMPIKNTGFRAQTARGYRGGAGGERLLKGSAYGKAPKSGAQTAEEDWPMYRADAARRGSLPMTLPSKPVLKWSADLGGSLSQAVATGDKLYVAEKDRHRLRCLDRNTGRMMWQYTTAGRVDSAPTCAAGRLVAGCRDGHVYCLDARTGELIWRVRGAPHDASLVAYGQLESVWPVHGSLIVRDQKVYCLAGRSSYLNGGMVLGVLDLETGEVLQEKKLVPDLTSSYEADEGLRSDLMVADGDTIRIRHMAFDPEGLGKLTYAKGASRGPSFRNGLSAFSGFLDDSWFNTTVWALGSAKGQVMAHDDTHVFGLAAHRRFGQSCGHDIFKPAQGGYRLFCQSLSKKSPPVSKAQARKTGRRKRGAKAKDLWSHMVPVRGEAMLLGGKCIYLAGTRDVVDEKEPWAHVEGRKGGLLAVYARADGKKLSEVPLSSAPAFDGMSASHGNVYLIARDGKIHCYE